MNYNNLTTIDRWWSDLSIAQKERIATKAKRKDLEGLVPVERLQYYNVKYPECTTYWNSLQPSRKQTIYEHCTDKHGLLLPEWQEGKSMSY